ncbi:MAG TPA: hypothetical protein VF486_13905 [Actinomycetes bacterium]
MQPARASARLLAACRRRAVPPLGRALGRLRRRPSRWAVALLLALQAAGGHAEPAPTSGAAAALDRVTAADLPGAATATRPPGQRPRPPGAALTAAHGRASPPWPLLGQDTTDHLLTRALGEIRRLDPARYRQMRQRVPRWGLSRCDRVLCDRNVQGQTLLTGDGECLSTIDPAAALRAARRYGIPGLPWLADVLVHEHAHCHDLGDEYSSLAAQRDFLGSWPAGPGRERAMAYVRRLYRQLDASGNWSSP